MSLLNNKSMFLDLFFIFVAKYLFILSIIIAGIYFLRQSRDIQKRMVVFSVLTLILVYLFATIAGYLYYDPRPFVQENFTPLIPHTADNGFPSDHVLLVSVIAAVFSYFNKRLVVTSLWVLALLVAVGRVYVGVHHVIDVIASMFISLLSAYIIHLILKYYASHKKLS